MKSLIVLLFFLLFSASPSMASRFDGKYRLNSNWDCKIIGADGGAMAITGNIMTGVENQCVMKNPVRVRGMDAVLYDFVCNGEGENWSTRAMIMKADEGIVIIYPGYSGTAWQRCPR